MIHYIQKANRILTTFSHRLERVARQPNVFSQFNRGVERETLRYTPQGAIAQTPHPIALGSALTHGWITTDFAESLLEFITPVSQQVETLLAQLADIHHFTQSQLKQESLWPLSMPCYVGSEEDIQLAQYGHSNIGRMKTLYRQGLKHRYGSLMQIISGVHFNFSFSNDFWDALFGKQEAQQREQSQSEAYFGLIRNYYRYGWLIPYFFGASPALCSSFVKDREVDLPFEAVGETLYLPYATSLRLSDLGYTNHAQSALKIGFNSLDDYLMGLNKAIHTPSAEFARLGVKVGEEYRQLNSHVLQIENELYAPIRPKRVMKKGEKPSEALARAGVEYIEVRALDVNPFNPDGISEQQVRFLDLFLTWAVLSDSPLMTEKEQARWGDNWRKVVMQGRDPELRLQLSCDSAPQSLAQCAQPIMAQLRMIAQQMDAHLAQPVYEKVCDELDTWLTQPEKTLSAQMLAMTKELGGLSQVGLSLGQKYREQHLAHHYQTYDPIVMEQEVQRSLVAQQQLEEADILNFDDFLIDYFDYLT